MKTLAATYLIAEPPEKREIAEIATSNRTVSVKSPYVQPSDWLEDVGGTIAGLSGPPERTTSRTKDNIDTEPYDKLFGHLTDEAAKVLLEWEPTSRLNRY